METFELGQIMELERRTKLYVDSVKLEHLDGLPGWQVASLGLVMLGQLLERLHSGPIVAAVPYGDWYWEESQIKYDQQRAIAAAALLLHAIVLLEVTNPSRAEANEDLATLQEGLASQYAQVWDQKGVLSTNEPLDHPGAFGVAIALSCGYPRSALIAFADWMGELELPRREVEAHAIKLLGGARASA